MDTTIIGGADGPTAIFIATSGSEKYIIAFAVVILAGAFAFWVRRKKKKGRKEL